MSVTPYDERALVVPAFRLLFVGESLSLMGSQVSAVALPLTAVLALDASPFELGLLGAAQFAPFLLVSLFAGEFADRHARRGILLAANAGRALALIFVPVLWALGTLEIAELYAVALAVGTLTVFFDVAYHAIIVDVVDAPRLGDANGKLTMSTSVAEVAGPGLGGVLVQALTAPLAILADVASYGASLLCLARMHVDESPLSTAVRRVGARRLLIGMHVGLSDAYLRSVTVQASVYNFCHQILLTLFFPYAIRVLGVSVGSAGLALSAGGLGATFGSMASQRVTKRAGVGSTITLSMLLACAGPSTVPLIVGRSGASAPLLAVAMFAGGAGMAMFNVQAVGVRQRVVPRALLGRVIASLRLISYGSVPLGGLTGGVLGAVLGLRAGLAVAAAGFCVVLLFTLTSPLRGVFRLTDLSVPHRAYHEA